MACQDDQLCAVLKAVIDSTVHISQAIWDENLTTENWGFLLVDADNAFKNIIWFGMLWKIKHLWPSGAWFVFKWYYHWSSLVFRNSNRMASFLHNKDDVTHVDPLVMIAYGIIILPLINNFRQEVPDVTQTWYADKAGALDPLRRMCHCIWCDSHV